jgi:hypothetical protein
VKEIARLLNDMLDAGVISDYALFGALAQIRYTEPVATLDADVLVGVPQPDKLDVLGRGYLPEGEAIRVGDWPLQFIPTFSSLTREAMKNAEATEFEGTPFRVVRADYLAAIALEAGRAKDMARILALLESGSVTPEAVGLLAARHGLLDSWKRFEERFLSE